MKKDRRRKSILVVQQFYFPDISAVSQLLGDLLSRLVEGGGYEITVLCGSDARADSGDRPRWKDGVRILRIPTAFPSFLRGLRILFQAFLFHLGTLLYLLLGSRYDCVIAMTTPPLIGFTVSMALRARRSRLLYYVEDLYPELLLDAGVIRKSLVAKKVALFNRITLRRAQKVVVIGSYMQKKLMANYGVSATQFEIVENWTSGIHWVPPQTHGTFVMMYSGNLGFAHDFALFERFVSNMRRMPVRYRFIGAGRRFEYIKCLFRECGESRIEARGYLTRSEHGTMLSTANIFILAQSAETVGDILPSKYYSYLAAGRPIIFFGPQRSEIGETIIREGIGAVVEIPEDVKAAQDLVASYLSDPELYQETCRRAAMMYDSTGGLERAVAQFVALVDDVLRPAGSAG